MSQFLMPQLPGTWKVNEGYRNAMVQAAAAAGTVTFVTGTSVSNLCKYCTSLLEQAYVIA